MPTFKVASRCREKTTTTGTGAITLAGLLHPTERLFSEAIGDGNLTSYVLISGDGTSVEEGIGTYTASTNTLARRVLRSTNSDSLIALTGTSSVYSADLPAITPAGGPTWHAAVAVATTGALPACTYTNGVAGRGAALTASANGALTIDGVALLAGLRVLVKDQAAPAQNGIYVATQPGGTGAPFVLTRALDYDDEIEIYEGDCVAVGAAGQSNGRTLWTMFTAAASIVIGTADINWSLIGIRNSEGLDLIGATPGDMLYRGPTDWAALAPGTAGNVLTMVSGAPAWAAPSGGGGGTAVSTGGTWDATAAYPVAAVVRYHGAFYESNAAIAAVVGAATPDFDPGGSSFIQSGGLGNNFNYTSISTTRINSVIFAVITCNSSATITTPPALTGAGAFTRLSQKVNAAERTEVWWAPAATVLTNSTLTAAFSASCDHSVVLFTVGGASLAAPFDPDPLLPATGNGSAVTARTVNPLDLVIYWDHGNDFFFNTNTPAGFTLKYYASYQPAALVVSSQSRTTIMGSTVLDAANDAIHCGAFAVTAAANPTPDTDSRWVLMAIADSVALDGAYGNAVGTVLYRGASGWTALAPGATNTVLTIAGGVPTWAAPSGGGGGTPPTIVQAVATVGTTAAVTLPAAPAQGHVLLAFCTHWSNGVTVSNGWTTLLNLNGASTDGIIACYKVAGASEPAAQTPFSASSGGQSTILWELAGVGGVPAIAGSFGENHTTPLTLNSFNGAAGLVVGTFSVQASSYDYPLTGATATDANVTGTTPNNTPRRIKGFHVTGSSVAAAVTATLDAAHDSAGMIFFIPGS